jgi:Ca-activated chloride channel homolog
MQRTTKIFLTLVLAFLVTATALASPPRPPKPSAGIPQQGELEVVGHDGQTIGLCPLKHTDVKAEISGFISRVTVTQHFWNPSKQKIEAVYVFPLPNNAAVDDMTLKVNDRTIKGLIKKRDEAQAIYNAAKNAGHVAALLDQERPNIFTQSVANIVPGAQVTVEISYVETLKYEAGSYEFVFPMVVGPRYIPGSMAVGQQGGGWSPDTDRVPDASRITPPVAGTHTPNERAGHDISIDVTLDAGVPIQEFRSILHDVLNDRTGPNSAHVRLKDEAVIPNKDFILKYDVSGGKIEDALLTHHDSRGGFFAFILQPPDRVNPDQIVPREIVFVIDTSGSQMGFPLEKSKKLADLALAKLNPNDTFNIITFAGNTQILFPEPVPATPANMQRARALLGNLTGGGGTEMMSAIRAALDPSDATDHLRVVVFMTDGYVGNDMEIIGEVKKHQNARVFTLGIGNSVNRFLIDKMAEAGRGENEVVTLADAADPAVERLFERIRTPILTDVSIDWNGMPVAEIYPAKMLDLFTAKPVIVTGRYSRAAKGTIRLKGMRSGQPFSRDIAVNFPSDEKDHDVLATLWARTKIEHLMSQDWNGMQTGGPTGDLKQQITALGLQYRLMTQFTSFVAVEEMTITEGGQAKTVQVPVEMPDGVSRAGVFGARDGETYNQSVRGSANLLYASPGVASSRAQYSTNAPTGYVSGGTGLEKTYAADGVSIIDGEFGGIGVYSRAKSASESASQPAVPAKEDAKNARAEFKLSPALQQTLHCMQMYAVSSRAPSQKGEVGCATDKDGKIRVQLQLTDKSVETMKKLQALGFEIVTDPRSSATVAIGRISALKLTDLSKLDAVRYVSSLSSAAADAKAVSKGGKR